MKAITVHQPWASLLAIGAKQFETRGWQTHYRGPIAIHAAKVDNYSGMPFEQRGAALNTANAVLKKLLADFTCVRDLPHGAIVATAELVECHKIIGEPGKHPHYKWDAGSTVYDIVASHDERMFGDWTPGYFAWQLVNVAMLPEPIKAKGQQGLWNWEAD